jgi:hypothetical protein
MTGRPEEAQPEDARPGEGRSGFTQGGLLDVAQPSAELCGVLDKVCGADRRCAGLSDDEVVGVLGRWQAVEAWAAAGKLGVVRALICRRAVPGLGTCGAGGLPRGWRDELTEEVMQELAVSRHAADRLVDLAWVLEARLPGIGADLAAGVIDAYKAQVVADATAVLDDEHAAAVDGLLAGTLGGKTPGEIGRLAGRAVIRADPVAAEARQKEAEVKDARVRVWREWSGTAGLAGFGLAPGAALAAEQAVQDRAAAYKKAGIAGSMDQLRARAFADKLAGIDARGAGDVPAGLAANVNLTFPLLSLLGWADNPGEVPGWGAVDPALCRDLAARAAAAGSRSGWHLTVTDSRGHAVGHGCARPGARAKRAESGKPGAAGGPGDSAGGPGDGEAGGPAPGGAAPGDAGLPRELTLTLPDGAVLAFTIYPIPVTSCDHRYESKGHDPGRLLRHLTEVRDGTCTLPGCARPARRCDYEHATPFEKGGRTCGCNGGCRCRRDHQVKQSEGWTVRQVLPGWHQWTTPSGRVYTKGPKEYPA